MIFLTKPAFTTPTSSPVWVVLPACVCRFVRYALLSVALSSAAVAWAQPVASQPAASRIAIQLVDRIVAVVNREVVTQKEVDDRVLRVLMEMRQRGTRPPDQELLRQQVLERIIAEKVQLQFAQEIGLSVDDLQVDQTVARIAESNRLSLTEFRAALERDGLTFAKFRQEIRQEIILQRLREREVVNRITVAESEVDNFLADQIAPSADVRAEYNVSHVLVRVPEQSSPEEIERRRARALDVVRRLRSGTDFAQVAATFSDGPEALQGGGLGWRDQDRLPELFVDALVKMKPGEISEPLRSPAGFHVLLLMEKRGSGGASAATAPVQQQRARHILMRTNELVSERDARQRMMSLRERIENGADFAELARVHSEDGSASKGGDLGWIYPGDTVPDFERAMNALQIMELSQPVKSPFGFHLIQVQERKLADMSDERKRMEVRRILRDRKSDEAFEEWLRQLRDRAYVELRNDDR